MALVPSSGVAFASMGVSAPITPRSSGEPNTTAKTDRLPLTESDIACNGQAWGAETEACLVIIARQAGKHETRSIRLVAIAAQAAVAPNIF